MLLSAQVLGEAGGPASTQLLVLVQPHSSFLMQELSDFGESGCNHPLPILPSDVLSKRTCALCFRGPSLWDWGRNSRSLPPLNHLSLEYQDCHSCSTGPFLETKQGHKRNVCTAMSDIPTVPSEHTVARTRWASGSPASGWVQIWSCGSLPRAVTVFGPVCQIIVPLLFLEAQCHSQGLANFKKLTSNLGQFLENRAKCGAIGPYPTPPVRLGSREGG